MSIEQPGVRLRGIRGATTLEADTREQVLERTQELVRAVFERNDVVQDDVVSIIFTATDDVRSAFPAEAARLAGVTRVALICTRELDIQPDAPGSVRLAIRLLATVYTDRSADDLRHVYLHGASQLRTDLPE